MGDILLLLAGAVVVNDFLLTRLPGVPVFAAADGFEPFARRLLVLAPALALAAFCGQLLFQLLPPQAAFLRIPAFTLGAILPPALALPWLRARHPVVAAALPTLTPLWLGNAAIVGTAVLASRGDGLVAALLASSVLAAGIALAQLLFFLLRERFTHADVPRTLQGMPVTLLTLGMMALALLGFAGLEV